MTLMLTLCGALLALGNPAYAQAAAMKGWELYSWSDSGQWRFSLLLGTNRTKGCAEIKSRAGTMTLQGLEAAFARLSPYEHIFWEPPGAANLADSCDLAYPPPEIAVAIHRRIKDLGLSELR